DRLGRGKIAHAPCIAEGPTRTESAFEYVTAPAGFPPSIVRANFAGAMFGARFHFQVLTFP
ncbi:MAG TPA: hypothetical protein VJ226_16475, partial [Bradyrhizobium sp.]|nr:hypothetical protein [Bradyrhizobium sp.]